MVAEIFLARADPVRQQPAQEENAVRLRLSADHPRALDGGFRGHQHQRRSPAPDPEGKRRAPVRLRLTRTGTSDPVSAMMVLVSRRIRVTAGVIRETVERCIRHNTSLLSAALAYYSLLSLAPAMYFVVAFAGFIIRRRAATDQVIAWADEMLGPAGARFVSGILNSTSTGKVATIAGVITLLYGSTVAFGALQDALNLVWEV